MSGKTTGLQSCTHGIALTMRRGQQNGRPELIWPGPEHPGACALLQPAAPQSPLVAARAMTCLNVRQEKLTTPNFFTILTKTSLA